MGNALVSITAITTTHIVRDGVCSLGKAVVVPRMFQICRRRCTSTFSSRLSCTGLRGNLVTLGQTRTGSRRTSNHENFICEDGPINTQVDRTLTIRTRQSTTGLSFFHRMEQVWRITGQNGGISGEISRAGELFFSFLSKTSGFTCPTRHGYSSLKQAPSRPAGARSSRPSPPG